MTEHDPAGLDNVDREIRHNELRERGFTFHKFEDCPPELEDQFIENILAYEEAPVSTWLDRLAARGYRPPAPESLTDEQLGPEIDRLASALGAMNAFMDHTNHLSDRELYERLVNDTLTEPGKDLTGIRGAHNQIELLSDSEEDTAIWLKHYANERTRAGWARDFPNDVIPEHEPPPYDRDRRFPKPFL